MKLKIVCPAFNADFRINVSAQRSAKSSDVYVDKNGVIRWSKDNAEVQGFGVNYTGSVCAWIFNRKKTRC
jgi:hypothetical protein